MGQMGVCKTGKAGNLHPRSEWEQLEDGCNSQTIFWLHRELHCTAKSTTGLQEQAAPDKHRVPEGCTHEYACCLILDLQKKFFQNLTVCQKVFCKKRMSRVINRVTLGIMYYVLLLHYLHFRLLFALAEFAIFLI